MMIFSNNANGEELMITFPVHSNNETTSKEIIDLNRKVSFHYCIQSVFRESNNNKLLF